MLLSELGNGESGIILKVGAKEPIKSRLTSMGFAKGNRVKMLKYTISKETYDIRVETSDVALRSEEALTIEVQRVENEL